jgi:hypothetical protein
MLPGNTSDSTDRARIGPDRSDSGSRDARRRAPAATDRAMTGATLEWVISLPMQVRPRQLCDRFPRIANTLARLWADETACVETLAGLLADDRGRRRGFPVVLRQEIERLMAYRTGQQT